MCYRRHRETKELVVLPKKGVGIELNRWYYELKVCTYTLQRLAAVDSFYDDIGQKPVG